MLDQQVTLDKPVLRRIAEEGWSEELAEEFLAEYGDGIARQIIVSLHRLRLIKRSVSPREATKLLPARASEAYENAMSDLWIALIGNLVRKYVKGVEAGSISQPFPVYLQGVIRHIALRSARQSRLLPGHSILASLRSLCRARKELTRRNRIAELTFIYSGVVRDRLVSQCPEHISEEVYRNSHQVVSYFFERFLVSQCPAIARSRSSGVLEELLQAFGEEDYARGLVFIGSISQPQRFTNRAGPFSSFRGGPEENEAQPTPEVDARGDGAISGDLELRGVRHSFWECLLRGGTPAITEIDRAIRVLSREGSARDRSAYITLRACAELAASGSEATKRTLRAAIAYWFSNAGSPDPTRGSSELDLHQASLDSIIGMRLTWRQAACAFGCNPDDFSAYHRLCARLETEYRRHWDHVYGSSRHLRISEA